MPWSLVVVWFVWCRLAFVVFWASLEREKERKSEETGRTEASTSVLLHPQLSSTPHRRPRCPTLKLPPRLPTSLTTPWVPHRAGELSHGPVHLLTSSSSSARSLANRILGREFGKQTITEGKLNIVSGTEFVADHYNLLNEDNNLNMDTELSANGVSMDTKEYQRM